MVLFGHAFTVKLFSLVDKTGDGYPKQAWQQFISHSRAELVKAPEEADLIWIFSYYLSLNPLLAFPEALSRIGLLRRKTSLKNIPIVTTLHHLSPYKKHLWQPKINALDKLTNYWHILSEHSRRAIRPLVSKPILSLPYWVDTKQFFPVTDTEKQKLKQAYNLPANKLIIGSFQRDTESDLVSPKLEKGPDLLCDALEELDKKTIFVLLSGSRRHYVEKRLTAAHIPFLNVGSVPFEKLNELYNLLDCYLILSRIEGGPQAILEAMAAKTKIFSTHVGIADLLDQRVLVTDPADATHKLQAPYPDVLEQHYQAALTHDVQKIVQQYDQEFQELIKK